MLADFWGWITQLGNSKIVALLIFFPTFLGIVWYAFFNRARSQRLESYKYIPFQDDDESGAIDETGKPK